MRSIRLVLVLLMLVGMACSGEPEKDTTEGYFVEEGGIVMIGPATTGPLAEDIQLESVSGMLADEMGAVEITHEINADGSLTVSSVRRYTGTDDEGVPQFEEVPREEWSPYAGGFQLHVWPSEAAMREDLGEQGWVFGASEP